MLIIGANLLFIIHYKNKKTQKTYDPASKEYFKELKKKNKTKIISLKK